MDVLELAKKIHSRRSFSAPGASPALAGAEALVCNHYGIELTIDSFGSVDMSVVFRDVANRKARIVTSPHDPISVDLSIPEDFDVLIFAVGDNIDNVDVLGWLPDTQVRQAHQVQLSVTESQYSIPSNFLFPLPDELDFRTPDLDVPKVWSYEDGGWWTTYGFFVFDKQAEAKIKSIDEELAR